ncbi:hypothetical protein B723_09865 [Pseudomonas fluorescens NCIMB 11764]|uniref:Uncharacterized protein n=1 Tax=Pseudomonas fluorescens NCIMB 11764 TaxID=1221522 RepID=A0A0K1QMK8_PSEFL|nr:hypothetical protein B723_09865 [Pseudomonas fluorescens NCIMB 11764]
MRTELGAGRTILQSFLAFSSIAIKPLVGSANTDSLRLSYLNRSQAFLKDSLNKKGSTGNG